MLLLGTGSIGSTRPLYETPIVPRQVTCMLLAVLTSEKRHAMSMCFQVSEYHQRARSQPSHVLPPLEADSIFPIPRPKM